MNQRNGPWIFAILLLCCGAFPPPAGATEIEADVAVVGATPGGIAAAVSAARLGHRVALIEYEDHIGGIVSNGLTNSDIHNTQAVGGLFLEFTRRVLKYYRTLDKLNTAAPNVKLCHSGYWFEARVAERIYRQMLAEEGPRIGLHLGYQLKGATVHDGHLTAIDVEDRKQPGQPIRIRATVFIDATYEGDLAAMAGAPFRVGRESRGEFAEPHAGKIFARFGQKDLLPGSTGEADGATEAYCFRFQVTQEPGNRVAIEKPAGYCRDDYRAILADFRAGRIKQLRQVIQLYPMPNGKFELNSDHPHPDTGVPSESFDLAEDNWRWPTATPQERRQIYQRYLCHNVGLLWLLQNDAEVPMAVRQEAQQLGWCRDEWPDNGHLPRQVYVRQGRRIEGEYMLTEHDGDLDAALQRTRLQPTSIGIAEFPFDCHATRKFDPAHPGVREGYIFITHPPLQIPYGVIVPRKIEGLLVPVACSASHVGYNALRMEPLFMALGQTAGTAAHMAIRGKRPVRSIPVGQLQQLLVERGAVITLYDDLPWDHPAFAAFQWLGARGLNPGYRATPERKLTRRDGWERLARILQAEGHSWQPPTGDADSPLLGKDVAQWLRQAGCMQQPTQPEWLRWLSDQQLDLSRFAVLVYRVLAGNPPG